MKGKGTTLLLIGVVAVVWGLILYRVFAAYQADDEPAGASVMSTVSSAKEPANDYSNVTDTTKLLLNYRDPFEASAEVVFKDTAKHIVSVTHVSTVHLSKPANVAAAPVPPAINWSLISYTGYIRNPSSKKLLALVQVNGKELMMSEGETMEQVRLLRNLRDSIKVSYQGKTRFITLNTSNP